ncbi:acyl carrier protein [Syntrophomonas wolfei]|uniref:Acyl carrier protein n=2 Tax=Syntrophomonas TaxID=862 RepID=Q0AVV7_SYNWW|nr:acyl carrier protein [Syntrophomonas wolfei]ABI69147.1 acyl carrier protein [Syntrophomonas wolfei subsp. wolfei str. Goettingen G311]
MNVFEELKKIIVEIKDIPEDEIQLESKFAEDLEADSLDIVEMLMLLEEKFEIQIPEEEAAKLKTVKNVVDYVEAKLQ